MSNAYVHNQPNRRWSLFILFVYLLLAGGGAAFAQTTVASASLTLVVTATPNMISTPGGLGTTSLSATVSGGTPPYSYTFNGPGTITPTGNTASVSGISSGVQTFNVIVKDATLPTALTISQPVSVTVSVQPTISSFAASGSLGSGSCSVGLTASACGKAFVFTSDNGYVYSTVFRVQGCYTVSAPGVMKPGSYTLQVYDNGGAPASLTTSVQGDACP